MIGCGMFFASRGGYRLVRFARESERLDNRIPIKHLCGSLFLNFPWSNNNHGSHRRRRSQEDRGQRS